MPAQSELTGKIIWQVACGRGKWQDINPTWTEPMLDSLRMGRPELEMLEEFVVDGEMIQERYMVDMSDHTRITQQRRGTRKRHEMRVIQLKRPRLAE